MPPLPSVPLVLKATLQMRVADDFDVLTRHFIEFTGTNPTSAELDTFGAAIASAWSADLASQTRADCTLETVTCEDLSSSTGAVGVHTSGAVGTRSGAALAPGSCVVIQNKIARRYRGGKPKNFWPFGIAADVGGGGVWVGSFLSGLVTQYASYQAAVIASGWSGAGTLQFVNVSYFAGFTVVTNPITHRARNVPTLRGVPVVDPIVAFLPDTRIGSQRRRNG